MKAIQTKKSSRFSVAWFRGEGLWQRALAMLVAVSFGAQAVGCASNDGSPDPNDSPDSANYSERVVQAELTGRYVDPESGELTSVSIAQDEFALGDYRWHGRELIVDGTPTLDVEDMQTGAETIVPLRNGGHMTIHRTGDVLEVVEVVTEASYDSTQLPRLRIGDQGLEVLGQGDTAGGIALRVRGVEDLPGVERALVLSLGLDILLASVEDADQVAPLVIAAAVAAVVGAAWMAACGVTLITCINRCNEEFEVKCAFLDIDVDWPKVKVGGALSFGCSCR